MLALFARLRLREREKVAGGGGPVRTAPAQSQNYAMNLAAPREAIARTVPEEFYNRLSFLPLSSYAHFTSNCFSVFIKGRIARKILRPTPKIQNTAAELT